MFVLIYWLRAFPLSAIANGLKLRLSQGILSNNPTIMLTLNFVLSFYQINHVEIKISSGAFFIFNPVLFLVTSVTDIFGTNMTKSFSLLSLISFQMI